MSASRVRRRGALLAGCLAFALTAVSALAADKPPTPAWPDLKAAGVAPSRGEDGESYPQYALTVRNHKLVAAIATGEVPGGLGMLALRDGAGRKFQGDPGEDTMLLGSALPDTNDVLDDIVATRQQDGPPQGSPDEMKKHALRVDFVVSVKPDGTVRNLLVVNEPNRQFGDTVVMKAHELHFEAFTPKDGQTVRWFAGAVYFAGAGK